jgi:hypothetical protein
MLCTITQDSVWHLDIGVVMNPQVLVLTDNNQTVEESALLSNQEDENANLEHTTDGSDEGELKVQYSKEGVSIEKNDRSLSEFERWYKQGRLIIDPEWQRSYVWDKRRASKLIESFLVDIPVPVIYLGTFEN